MISRLRNSISRSSAGPPVTVGQRQKSASTSVADAGIVNHRSISMCAGPCTTDPEMPMPVKLRHAALSVEDIRKSLGDSDDELTTPVAGGEAANGTARMNSNETPASVNRQSSSGGEPKPFVTFLLKVRLIDGKDLVIRDAGGVIKFNGSSDPYVKFKYDGKLCYKSNTIFRSLSPIWDETFAYLVDDPTTPLIIECFDYDRFATDDFMGGATLDLSQYTFWQSFSVRLDLSDPNSKEDYMGYINMQICIEPQTEEDKENFLREMTRSSVSGQGRPRGSHRGTQSWNSVANIAIVEARSLIPTEMGRTAPLPDPYVKFRLGPEKYKTKSVQRTLEPKWLEQFDLHIFDEKHQTLEIMVYDRRTTTFMGRCEIDLTNLEREITHQIWQDLDDGAGQLLLLISITGTSGSDTVSDLSTYAVSTEHQNQLVEQYNVVHSFSRMKDVGYLVVKVFKAQGLASADLGGKSDPFCVLELVNARLQTHTEYKTLNPEWNKIFTFNVKDVHEPLELTVYDEDPNKKVEFLGKIAIPLLKIRNGEKRWYALKDRKLTTRAKGQILVELSLIYNPVRASVRTFNPRESKYLYQEPKFKRQELMRNVNRLKAFGMTFVEYGAFMNSLFNWESPARSFIGFVTFIIIVYNFQLCHVPLCLLLMFVKAYIQKSVMDNLLVHRVPEQEEYFDSGDEEEEIQDEKKKGSIKVTPVPVQPVPPEPEVPEVPEPPPRPLVKDGHKSLKDRLAQVTDTMTTVQNSLDFIASLLERIRNTFNFTQPFLSWLAIFVLSVATLLLYLVPLRWLVMAWGINKFTKKLRAPHAIPNNELLDFLSRVPCDTELRWFGEYRPDPIDRPLPAAPIDPKKSSKSMKK